MGEWGGGVSVFDHKAVSEEQQSAEEAAWENLVKTLTGAVVSFPACPFCICPLGWGEKWGNRLGRLKTGTEFLFSKFIGSALGPM